MDREEHSSHAASLAPQTIADLVAYETGTSPLNCYQCGRCAAGCLQNVPGEMELSPTRIMHILQLESALAEHAEQAAEQAKRALSSDTPWLCAGCLACTTRCPQGLDIAGTMDVLRQESLKRGMASKSRRAKDVQALHQTFLQGALKHGRIHELFLIMIYKLKTWHWFQDAMLGPAMFLKGKIHLLPGKKAIPTQVAQATANLKLQQKSKV